jgi:class 3 adenylate cyclase
LHWADPTSLDLLRALAGADEDRILARLRTLRSDLIDPIISVHHGRIVKRTGDGSPASAAPS